MTLKVTTTLKELYRYFCHACTGVAFICEGTEPKNTPSVCNKCGNAVGSIKPENFLRLEPTHPAMYENKVVYK